MQTLGGLGLFLLGMIVMTEGLRALAGSTMRTALMRFTRSPVSGAITGAASTALLQSSSATTVAAVGFVGAGLMRFSEALGIIFGANIGTTLKGWIIVLLGFKFPLGTLVLPVIFVGAILKLFGKSRLANIGYAMAGFALIFVGIATLQQGMSGLSEIISPASLPDDTLVGRLQLVVLGIIATLITQSSSAGVATALTALYAGAINFEQAAALVIGMDIGTTVTAAIATIGGSVASRRTGYSHVIYNLFTGMGALLLISPFILLWETIAPGQLYANAEIALVAFHTSFNTLGVIIVLPFTQQFARLMQRLVTTKEPIYTEKLDKVLLQHPKLALSVVMPTVHAEFIALLGHLDSILGDMQKGKRVNLHELQLALDETHTYVDQIQLQTGEEAELERLVAIIHTLDHMQRLHERCEEEEDRAVTARETDKLTELRLKLIATIKDITVNVNEQHWFEAAQCANDTAVYLQEQAEVYRDIIMKKIASGEIEVPQGTEYLRAIRWLRRVSKHLARITHHLAQTVLASGK